MTGMDFYRSGFIAGSCVMFSIYTLMYLVSKLYYGVECLPL